MLHQKKILKLQLKNGDLSKDILEVLEKESKTAYLLVSRDFPLITESAFLKKIKSVIKKRSMDVFFVTEKKYFTQTLKALKFEVLEKVPEEVEALDLKLVKDFSGNIVAEKNVFISKKIEFKPKITGSAPSFSTHKIQNLKDEKSIRSFFFFLFLAVIFLLVALFFWISPRATITIKPLISVIPITQNVLVSLSGADISAENEHLPQIPGIFVETEVVGTETFPSTQKEYDLTNARGKVTIFNETNEPKFFIPSRLSTLSGIIFRTQKDITVPPKKDGKAGRLIVEIVADAYTKEGNPIGGRGNIEAGMELFFPGLRKESRELYYAKTNQGPLVGGSTLTHYFIGENDFELAKPLLHQGFRVRGIENLQKELVNRGNREGKKYILLDRPGLLKAELIEYVVDESLIGKEQQTFEIAGKAKISGIVFDQDVVLEVLIQKIQTMQDHRKKLIKVDESSVKYRLLESDKFEEDKWLKLSVSLLGMETLNFEAKNELAQRWYRDLKKEIAGKDLSQVRNILVNHPEIEQVLGIKVSPFWAKSLPVIFEQIDLKIKY